MRLQILVTGPTPTIMQPGQRIEIDIKADDRDNDISNRQLLEQVSREACIILRTLVDTEEDSSDEVSG